MKGDIINNYTWETRVYVHSVAIIATSKGRGFRWEEIAKLAFCGLKLLVEHKGSATSSSK